MKPMFTPLTHRMSGMAQRFATSRKKAKKRKRPAAALAGAPATAANAGASATAVHTSPQKLQRRLLQMVEKFDKKLDRMEERFDKMEAELAMEGRGGPRALHFPPNESPPPSPKRKVNLACDPNAPVEEGNYVIYRTK